MSEVRKLLSETFGNTGSHVNTLHEYEKAAVESFAKVNQIRNLFKLEALSRTILEDQDLKNELTVYFKESEEIITQLNKIFTLSEIKMGPGNNLEETVDLSIEIIKDLRKEREKS